MYSGSILRQKSTSNITDALKHMIEIVCIIDFLGKLRSDDLFDLFLSIYIKKRKLKHVLPVPMQVLEPRCY
jgi:hypothetical protein